MPRFEREGEFQQVSKQDEIQWGLKGVGYSSEEALSWSRIISGFLDQGNPWAAHSENGRLELNMPLTGDRLILLIFENHVTFLEHSRGVPATYWSQIETCERFDNLPDKKDEGIGQLVFKTRGESEIVIVRNKGTKEVTLSLVGG